MICEEINKDKKFALRNMNSLKRVQVMTNTADSYACRAAGFIHLAYVTARMEILAKPLRQRQLPLNECVKVVVRCRPISKREVEDNHVPIIKVVPERGLIQLCNPAHDNAKKIFTYDCAYDWNTTQTVLYDEVVRPLVASVLTGFNGCVFAYGQTGTGKTYTMEGDAEQIGVIPKSFEQIWNHINRTTNTNFLVTTSYLEIYMEELKDLLNKNNDKTLEIREREGWGTYVPDLHSVVCKSVEDMMRVMRKGNRNRTIGHTNMNTHSSRSHAAFMITIEMCDTHTNTVTVGKLNLIDLAGSERQNKTGATAERLKEASKINKSLSSLGNVISALAENSPHIPYRDSKLTRLLQDSLGGNSKTIMIANIGPASYNYDETLTTLRYAHRAKTIQNLPVVNEDPKDAKVREYQSEITRLKALIEERKLKEIEDRKRTTRHKLELDKLAADNKEEIIKQREMIRKEEELRRKQLDDERTATEALAKQLEHLESQLVRGGVNIIDSVAENQIEIEERLAAIAERKQREIEMQQKLMQEEETTLGIRETYSSLQQEVEAKTKKLEDFNMKVQAAKQELQDLKDEHIRDRTELEQTQNALVKEMKLKLMIIDNFIPNEIKDKFYANAKFDEDMDIWTVAISKEMLPPRRPISKPGRRRPAAEVSLLKKHYPGLAGIRHRGENIIEYDLDMPFRTTFEYEAPTVSPSLQSVLEDALQPEGDLEITSPRQPFFRTAQIMKRPNTSTRNSGLSQMQTSGNKLSRPKTTSTKSHDSNIYPKTRGLVPK